MAVALVQQKNATTPANTTNSATFDAGATAGNLIVALIAGDKNTGALTMSGYTSQAELTSTSVCLYFRYKVAAGGETTISATTASGSAAGNTMWIGEYGDSGVAGSTWAIAGSATNITSEASVTSTATGTTGTLTGDGLAIAVCAIDSANGSPTYSWNNGYSTRFSTGTTTTGVGQMSVAEKAVTSGTTTTSTVTSTGSADQISAAVAVIRKVSSTVNGTAAGSLGALTAAATGTHTVLGTATASLGGLAGAATGTPKVLGTATSTLGVLAASATGTPKVLGVAAAPLGALTASAVAVAPVHGVAAAALGGLSGSATGTRSTTGTAAAALGALTATATDALPDINYPLSVGTVVDLAVRRSAAAAADHATRYRAGVPTPA